MKLQFIGICIKTTNIQRIILQPNHSNSQNHSLSSSLLFFFFSSFPTLPSLSQSQIAPHKKLGANKVYIKRQKTFFWTLWDFFRDSITITSHRKSQQPQHHHNTTTTTTPPTSWTPNKSPNQNPSKTLSLNNSPSLPPFLTPPLSMTWPMLGNGRVCFLF